MEEYCMFFFLMIRRPPRSTLFPYRRSSDLTRSRGASRVRSCRHGGGRRGVAWRAALSQPLDVGELLERRPPLPRDRKSTRLNSSHLVISYAVFCLKKKNYILTQQVSARIP